MDICIVADTEEVDRQYFEEPTPEHVNVIEDFQDKDFDPIEKKKQESALLVAKNKFYKDDEETNQIANN